MQLNLHWDPRVWPPARLANSGLHELEQLTHASFRPIHQCRTHLLLHIGSMVLPTTYTAYLAVPRQAGEGADGRHGFHATVECP